MAAELYCLALFAFYAMKSAKSVIISVYGMSTFLPPKM